MRQVPPTSHPAANGRARETAHKAGNAMTSITGLLNFDELMAGLVPDRGRGSVPGRGVAIPCRLAFTSQLTRATPSRKQPETANVITLADRHSAPVQE